MIVFVRALPPRILSPNGGTRDKPRTPGEVVDAMYEFGSAVYHAILDLPEPVDEHYDHAIVTFTLYAKHGAHGRCPRCRGRCQCYRPRSPSNFSGDIATAILNGLVRHGVIDGTTFTNIDEVRLRVRPATEIANEGVLVEIVPVHEPVPEQAVTATSSLDIEAVVA